MGSRYQTERQLELQTIKDKEMERREHCFKCGVSLLEDRKKGCWFIQLDPNVKGGVQAKIKEEPTDEAFRIFLMDCVMVCRSCGFKLTREKQIANNPHRRGRRQQPEESKDPFEDIVLREMTEYVTKAKLKAGQCINACPGINPKELMFQYLDGTMTQKPLNTYQTTQEIDDILCQGKWSCSRCYFRSFVPTPTSTIPPTTAGSTKRSRELPPPPPGLD
jgi:hypothetical protein